MVYRLILPKWDTSGKPKVLEGEFTAEELLAYNSQNYNIYSLPNYPRDYDPEVTVEGHHIDVFQYVFVDMDLKDGKYLNEEAFKDELALYALKPSIIVYSGNGVHGYWEVSDLDAMSFLKLQRRLCRYFRTDEAVSKIFQLMRVPGTKNTKSRDLAKDCVVVEQNDVIYTSEQISDSLPPLTAEDAEYCQRHYDMTYKIVDKNQKIDDTLPPKFLKLLRENTEVNEIISGNVDDRSKGDYRLGHIMLAAGFTKEEATSVLVNSSKALARGPGHRLNYATSIVDKIWVFEATKSKESLSSTVREILSRGEDVVKGTRFPCWSYIDSTDHGFRLGQVIGLVAGSGVGKTAIALNMFKGFVQSNPDFDHFFVCLEQPDREIADRWRTLCGSNTSLHDKVHVLSNYDHDGTFRNLSLIQIQDYILQFKKDSGRQVGCVVIDHIGALDTKNGEGDGIKKLCKEMKAFAIQTNTMLVMQSQSSREKAGIGDLELNKDAAYGTVFFESWCDYLITVWQPLKRCYEMPKCPTVTAFKFCKIRHKKANVDKIKEDVRYLLYFDPDNETLREMTQVEEKSFDFWNNQSVTKRKQDRKTDVLTYVSARGDTDGKVNSDQNSKRANESGNLDEGSGVHSS